MRRLPIVVAVILTASLLRLAAAAPQVPDEKYGNVNEKAYALLRYADALLGVEDWAGALEKYMDAVRADPRAASISAIDRYSPSLFAPPPPKTSEAELRVREKKIERAESLELAAVRQYLGLHPNDWTATQRLLMLVKPAEAESLIAPFVEARRNDPEIYVTRGAMRAHNGDFAGAIADYSHASELDPTNPERHYVLGVVLYERVAKRADLSVTEKRDLIRRGLAELTRAEEMKPDYFEALAYHNLLLRQQAQLETDPAVQQKLVADADALRQKAIDIIKAKKAARQARDAEPPSSPTGPVRVGGDVKAPVLISRVEPVYPEEARRKGITGIVILEIVVDKEGRVTRAEVLKPIGGGGSEAAVAAVKQWRFKPATLNGEPVEALYNVTVAIKP